MKKNGRLSVWEQNIDGSLQHRPNNVIHLMYRTLYETRTHKIAFYGIFKWLSVLFSLCFSISITFNRCFFRGRHVYLLSLCSRSKWINHLNSNKIDFFNAENLRPQQKAAASIHWFRVIFCGVVYFFVLAVVILEHAHRSPIASWKSTWVPEAL